MGSAPGDQVGVQALVIDDQLRLRQIEAGWREDQAQFLAEKENLARELRMVEEEREAMRAALPPRDLADYDDLRQRYGAPGDFAQAYVLAHEVGHHVQNLLGISDKVQSARQRGSEAEGNALSVRLELQADCLAGMWAHHANRCRQILEKGDVEEALNAASVIGDDRMQRRARGYVTPDSFTHGSSAQRTLWFKRGLESGKLSSCDTFGATEL